MSMIRTNTEPMVLRVARAIARYIGFGEDDLVISPSVSSLPVKGTTASGKGIERLSSVQPPLRLMPSPENGKQLSSHKWRRHPQLRAWEAPLSEDVRQGRHDAVRALFAARAGALDVATRHFANAARCEDVDLTAVPGFWKLTRGQMQTAVNAYEFVGRYREAAALDAHIATIFRPSLVGSTSEPIVPVRPRHKAANT